MTEERDEYPGFWTTVVLDEFQSSTEQLKLVPATVRKVRKRVPDDVRTFLEDRYGEGIDISTRNDVRGKAIGRVYVVSIGDSKLAEMGITNRYTFESGQEEKKIPLYFVIESRRAKTLKSQKEQ